jgi:PAS domain S-box-containing protein
LFGASAPHWAWVRVSLLVFAAYYLGARLGLALTFSPLPISVLWPPNAILFATLLLLPTRLWPLVAVAALPAHLVSELQGGIPVAMVLCWYVSNLTEALVGAGAVRLLLGEAPPFHSLRGVMLFVLAAAFAAVVSSFLDAAFVQMNHWGMAGYWELWSSRLFANLTADLVVVPAILTAARLDLAAVRRASAATLLEAAAVAAGLAIVTIFVLDSRFARDLPPALLCLPLPFLLWAACRFGPAGAAASLSFVSLVAIVGAGQGLGVFGTRLPLENAHSVQVFVLCLGPTLLGLAAAIHERRGNDEWLRLSDKRFELVLQATRDAVYDRDLATGAMWWSHGGPGHFGYSRRDDLHHFESVAEAIHPEDRDRVLALQREAAAGAQAHWEAEFRLRRGDGHYVHVQEQGFLVRDSSGRAVRMIGAVADVTERHDMEELSHRLSHASRLTAMGELTASIAHEINQPMSAILANVDAAEMLLDAGRLDSGELRAILGDIRDDDLRAAEVIRHIRGLATKRVAEAEVFDATMLLASALRLVAPIARRRGVEVRGDFEAMPPVRGDRIHLQQVVLNLLFNAMDAMEDAAAESRRVDVVARAGTPGMAEIAIVDRGHGIPAGWEEKIFDRFYTTKLDGLGLGLSIARSLVVANGGRIWAQSSASGATLRFTIPFAPAAAAP